MNWKLIMIDSVGILIYILLYFIIFSIAALLMFAIVAALILLSWGLAAMVVA